nr:immunoglobulin heavy chain junction region [Macaca mulatta]
CARVRGTAAGFFDFW